MEVIELSEINLIKKWAEEVEYSLGSEVFRATLQNTYNIPNSRVYICTFDVESSVPSRRVKKVIREEADKYKDGRLYFMAYNDIKGELILLFYSFYLDDLEDITVNHLSPLL